VREIAKQIGTSQVTVLKRIKQLEKKEIIKSYTTRINYEEIGYDLSVIIKVRVSKGKLNEVGKKIITHKNVSAVYDITGDFDIMVLAKFKNRKSLDLFVKKIQTYEYIERTETILVLNTLKEEAIGIE
jgi:DNA-binding Lrp family transcriptional regulator